MEEEEEEVFYLVDRLINDRLWWGESVFCERLGSYNPWGQIPALEEKVGKWTKEHPVIWNVGIGPAASFVPTLTRLLFERTKDELYGPYDHTIHVRLPPAAATSTSSSTAQHRLAFEVLMEMEKTLRIPLLGDIKQLFAEESYFGYGTISDYLMLQVFGWRYIYWFGADRSMLTAQYASYDRGPFGPPIVERIKDALQGKRHLLLIENLHAPILLDVLTFTMGERRPSPFLRPWIVSTTSKDVYTKSREASNKGIDRWELHLSPEYYHALPFDDLHKQDWTVLIREALRDAARSIHSILQDQEDIAFWLHVVQHCLYYGILYHPLQGSSDCPVTSDELVRCWVAEQLFSTRRTAKIPAASGKKQSNYYRSAYEVGKVVIQALQEYSLLPIYSVSSPTGNDTPWAAITPIPRSLFPNDAITGVSKLSEGVPRLKKDELANHHQKSNQLGWVSFMNNDGRHVSWNWQWRQTRAPGLVLSKNDDGRHVTWDWEQRETRDITMTTLILRGCSNMSTFRLDKLLTPHLRVLDLSYTPINSLPPSFSHLQNLYLLSLRGCSQLETLSPSPPSSNNSDKQTSPLAHLGNLQVLDINGVPLLELTKQDGSNKSNLHYLDLSGSKFTTLPTEFFCEMANLEEFVLWNCSNLKELPPSMARLSKLLVLHVEGSQITSFPEDMFQAMTSLHTLKLINNVLLMSLPMSLSEATGLKQLHLCDCIRLMSLPWSWSKGKCLRELHLSNCAVLSLEFLQELVPCLEDLYIETWKSLENIKIHGHPNLRAFSLSGPWIRCLSLRGCSKLKILNLRDDLIALEDVDISGTGLEEVPHNLPNLPQLRRLLLLGVPYFKRFPWHLLVRFPKIFYLDHCADDNQFHKKFCQQTFSADGDQQRELATNTAVININDPTMFHSFDADVANKLVKEGQFLQSFSVQVKPCSVRGKKPRNNEVELCTRIQRCSTYHDVQYSVAASNFSMMKLQPRQRHVEISAKNKYPNGLRHILSVTNSIFITYDDFIRCLTDLNYSLMSLEECQLHRCQQMTAVFRMVTPLRVEEKQTEVLQSLSILQASCLKNLICIVEPVMPLNETYYELITLKLLKHIHLEHCPNLEKLFPCCLSLPALETLIILFCPKLKTIFYKQPNHKVAPSPLPNIKRIYLQELPHLLHIHDDVLFEFETPSWEKLFVRGCQSFHCLPFVNKECVKSKVEVSGEREWWDKLQLRLPEQSDCYLHVAPPEFVSRKKHIIESYLR